MLGRSSLRWPRPRPRVLRAARGAARRRAALRTRGRGRGHRRLLRPSIGPLARLRPADRWRSSYASRICAPCPSLLFSLSFSSVSSIRVFSRQAPGRVGPQKNPPLRAGAGRTRSLGGCPSRGRSALPGALSLSVPVPGLAHAPRLPRQSLRRVAPAPAWSPAVGDDGARSATRRSAARMSSGRTAGVMCRTTIRSIAYPAFRSSTARRSVSMLTTAARASMRLSPLLVRRSTSRVSVARNASTAMAACSGPTPGSTTSHWDASAALAPQRPGFLGHVDHINPVRQGRVEPVPHVAHGARFRERKL